MGGFGILFSNRKTKDFMKTIKIFLASSAELDADKEQVELFIARKNKDYSKKRVFLELTTWKDFISAMTEDHSQKKYNDYIRSCDIALFLFHSKLGRFTKEEFETAHQSFLNCNRKIKKPMIFTYFKTDDHETVEISEFRNYIDSLEHFYDTYQSMDGLFVKLNRQLEKLENTGVIISEVIDVPKIVKYAVYYFLLPLLVLTGAFLGIYYFHPTDMTVRINEIRAIPELPFQEGMVILNYGDKTESLKIFDEVIFKQIPSKYKRYEVNLSFSAVGFEKTDTIIKLAKYIELPIKRDNSLGVIFGSIKDESGNPLKDVTITVKDLNTQTDENGLFRIEIPLEKQKDEQRLKAFKNGYQPTEVTGAPSDIHEWRLILYHQN